MKKLKFLGVLMMLVFASSVFVACSDDDDDEKGGVPSELVGVWIQKNTDYKYYIGIKISKEGSLWYSEWGDSRLPDFSRVESDKVRFSDSKMRITNPEYPEYYDEYRYELSKDGQTLTLTNVDWEDESYHLNGNFTKYEDSLAAGN